MIVTILSNRIWIENNYDATHYSCDTLAIKIYGIMKINNIKGKIQVDNENEEITVYAPMEDMYKLIYEITCLFASSIKEIR